MKILLAEDDRIISRGLEVFLSNNKHEIITVDNGEDALKQILRFRPDLIISDVIMPRKTGLELLSDLHEMNNKTPIIIITAHATVENAILAMKQGAYDFLLKPLNLEELSIKIAKIQKTISILNENKNLKERLKQFQEPMIIGNSAAINKVRLMIGNVYYDKDITVIIYGESGTGKELVARAIHSRGVRKNNPFIAINCAAIPDNLLESEFFGYKKGAFTGATTNKTGFFSAANKGTIFLDEVNEMSKSMQAKLLRVLQEKQIQPLGSNKVEPIDIQIIGASNENLKDKVAEGEFREDLFYRLSILEIEVPPLRERPGDIPLLLEYFLNRINSQKLKFSNKTLEILQGYAWPGNIRELENLVRKLNVTCSHNIIESLDLPDSILNTNKERNEDLSVDILDKNFKNAMEMTINKFEKKYLLYHLNKNQNNISNTAKIIGVSRVTLHKKIRDLKLESKIN